MKKQKEEIVEDLVEKSPLLKSIEKQEEQGIVKIDFGEEAPLSSIKKPKKPLQKPQEAQIQEEKAVKIEEKPEIAEKVIKKLPIQKEEIKEIKQEVARENKLLKKVELASKIVLKEDELLFKNMGKEREGMSDTEVKIEDLEKEIKTKKKELKIKKQEEIERKAKEEALRLEQKLEAERLLEAEKLKQEAGQLILPSGIVEKKVENQKVKLILSEEVYLKFCPICNSKIKRKPVKQQGLMLIQKIKCKNKKCNFNKEIIVRI